MRASSRPRNEAASARLFAHNLHNATNDRTKGTTTAMRGRSAERGGANADGTRASSRPRATTPTVSASPQPQPQRGGLVASFHHQQQQQSAASSRYPAPPNAHQRPNSGGHSAAHQHQQSFAMSPEGVVDFTTHGGTAASQRYDAFIHPRYGGALNTSAASDAYAAANTGRGINYDEDDGEDDDYGANQKRRGGNNKHNNPHHQGSGHTALGLMSSEALKELLDENDKLRVIEREFWVLLSEREALQDEVKQLKAHSGGGRAAAGSDEGDDGGAREGVAYGKQSVDDILKRHSLQGGPEGASSPSATVAALAAAKEHVARLQHENESLQIALHECMDLMITEEVRGSPTNTVKREGPVASFLGWLRMRHERGEVANALEATRHDLGLGLAAHNQSTAAGNTINASHANSPRGGVGVGAANDRGALKSLTTELGQAHSQMRALQQELDRTDLSRRQALDDCEHMRHQVETLKEQLQQTTAAFRNTQRQLLQRQVEEEGAAAAAGGGLVSATPSTLRGASALPVPAAAPAVGGGGGGPSSSNAGAVATLSAQLAHRNAEIHQQRAAMARLQREREAETYALASDTNRIREDLTRRRSQSAARADVDAGAATREGSYNVNTTIIMNDDDI